MASCANCSNDALYTYKVSEEYGIDYCQYHLPNFLNGLTNSNVVVHTPEFDTLKAEVVAEVAPSKKKKATPVVEEVVEETPVVEEAPVEETPTEETPVEEIPVEETPSEE